MPGSSTHGRRSIARRGIVGPLARLAGERDPPGGIDDEQTIRLVAGAAIVERRQQPGTQWR